MSLRLGSLTKVVISSPDAAREQDGSSLRPPRSLRSMATFDVVSLEVMDTGDKTFLTGASQSHEVRKVEESERTCNISLSKEANEASPSTLLVRACFITSLNVDSNVVFSIDLGSYDPRASTELQDSLSRMMKTMGKPNLANYFPSLEFLDLQGIRKEMKVMCSERLFQVFQGLIDARIPERSSQIGPRVDALRGDLLDSVIDLIQEEGSEVDMNDIKHFLCGLVLLRERRRTLPLWNGHWLSYFITQ
ncbi:Cytochrome P450 superfamily [Arabidopsis thaliana x Arabidopsis arenosa]|nr:Cytochrome P450 superfamily [Arabidopsis thaliana x Arabidopsis arenosa]